MTERRVFVETALARHQMRQELERRGVPFEMRPDGYFKATFVFDVDDEQWREIDAWCDRWVR